MPQFEKQTPKPLVTEEEEEKLYDALMEFIGLLILSVVFTIIGMVLIIGSIFLRKLL